MLNDVSGAAICCDSCSWLSFPLPYVGVKGGGPEEKTGVFQSVSHPWVREIRRKQVDNLIEQFMGFIVVPLYPTTPSIYPPTCPPIYLHSRISVGWLVEIFPSPATIPRPLLPTTTSTTTCTTSTSTSDSPLSMCSFLAFLSRAQTKPRKWVL